MDWEAVSAFFTTREAGSLGILLLSLLLAVSVRWLRLALDHNPFDAMLHTSLLVACVALEDRRCVDRSKAALVALKLDPDALPAVAPMGQGGGGGDR